MISLGVIVSGVFQGGSAKRPFAEENHSTETLVLDRSDESFGVGVQVGRARRQTDDLDAGVIQEISERRSELGIPVQDQELLFCEEAINRISDISSDLQHPGFIRVGSDPGDLNLPRRQLNNEEDIESDEATRCLDLDGEEVRRGDHVPMGLEKLAPGRSFASLWSGIDAVFPEDVGDGRPTNAVADVQQRALNSRVSPARVLSGHSHGEIGDGSHDSRSALASSLVGPLRSDELTVPSKNGVRRDERSDFIKSTTANGLAANCESAALIVCQPQSLLPELLLEGPILLSEVLDDCILLLADPAGQGGHEDLPGL